MNLEIYLFWTDDNGQRQHVIENHINWVGGIPRLNEYLVFESLKEAYLVEVVRHDFDRKLVSISAEFLPNYFSYNLD